MARRRSHLHSRPPAGLDVERLVVDGEELLVFSWSEQAPAITGLTAAEREVLARVVRGESNAAIAKGRKSSERTVANQIASLLRKTGARSRFDLIRRFSGVAR